MPPIPRAESGVCYFLPHASQSIRHDFSTISARFQKEAGYGLPQVQNAAHEGDAERPAHGARKKSGRRITMAAAKTSKKGALVCLSL
jgi:hypothetical protein